MNMADPKMQLPKLYYPSGFFFIVVFFVIILFKRNNFTVPLQKNVINEEKTDG